MFISILSSYLDVGSTSLAVQMLSGVVIGAGVAVKLYWEQIKLKFNKKGL